MLFLGRILRGKFYSKHGGIVLELGSIVLRLGRYRILLECRSLYPLSSDLCILFVLVLRPLSIDSFDNH